LRKRDGKGREKEERERRGRGREGWEWSDLQAKILPYGPAPNNKSQTTATASRI